MSEATAALRGVLAAAAGAVPLEDIRDIRGPKFVYPAWLLPALLGGAAVLLLGAYGVWRWRRRCRTRALLPFELALEHLAGIRALMQPATAREFSVAISGIVRTYIEQQFEVTATQRTTEEFLREWPGSSNAALARHRTRLAEFLQACDLVKFAGASLTPESMESLHQSAHAFVTETHDSLPAT